ncbi:actin cortical patch SUR7/pH-response regulator pali [Rhizoctonia solani]|nr:actin cortical patch SUR7/pH-response regulator pali [Rhizoctonia solani]
MLGVGFIVPFLVFAGFLLLLLVSLSIPIIKTISVLNIATNLQAGFTNTGISGGVKFGLWGYCVSEISASIIGINQSRPGYCSRKRLGYDIDNQLLELLGLDNLNDILSRGLTFVLVLHPIACGLAFLALLFALMLLFRPARLASAMALIFSVLAAIVATVAFAIDVALTTVAKNKVSDATDGNLKVTYGAVPWMTLGAMVALWAATVGACCGIFVGGRR